MKFITALFMVFGLAFVGAHASETMKGAKKDLESFKKEMSVKLDAAEKKLSELKADTKKKGDAAHQKTVDELQAARDKLRAELNELKEESGTKWQQFKKGFAESVDKLNSKVQEALKD